MRFTISPQSSAPAAGSKHPSRTAGRIVLAGMAGFTGAALVAGTIDPGYHPVAEMISGLAAQDAAAPALMIGGFLAAAGALMVAGITLFRRLTGLAARAGAVLVTLAGAGMVVAGLARQDCSQASAACLARESAGLASTAHWIHQFSSLALFTALVVAAPLLARGLRRLPRWQHLGRPMRWTALAGLLALVTFMSQTEGDYAGACQRVFLLIVFGWPVWLTYATSAWRNTSASPTASSVRALGTGQVPQPGGPAMYARAQLSFSAR
jgi:hypothetical protein